MKLLKQAGMLTIVSSLLLSAAPQVRADEAVSSSRMITIPVIPVQENGKPSDPSISKEEAIERARTYITIPAGYVLQSVSLSSGYGSYGRFPTWDMSYTKKVKDQNYGNLNVMIHALDGSLLSYSINDMDPDHKPSYPPKVDFKGAKEAAFAWIAKVNPDKQKELLYNDAEENAFRTPLNGDYQYNIRFDRAVDGVPFEQNGITVSVNGDGQVIGYAYNWDDQLAFEPKATLIPQEDATQLFRDKANLSLRYQTPYRASGQKLPITSYMFDPFSINAVTGEVMGVGTGLPKSTNGGNPLTDKPLADKPAATLHLTREQAVEKVRSAFNLSADYILDRASYNESVNPETGETDSIWSLNWSQQTEKDPNGKSVGGAWANVNSKTGEIQYFNSSLPYGLDVDKDVVGKVSLGDAQAAAIQFVKSYLPAYTDQLELEASVVNNYSEEQLKYLRNWEVRFNRVIDGVMAGSDGVNVSLDRTTGKIVNFFVNVSNLPYPQQKPQVLTIDQAKNRLLSQYNITLHYALTGGGLFTGSLAGLPIEKYRVMAAAGLIPQETATDARNEKPKAKLVYSLVQKYTREAFFLDAESGEWKSAETGEVISLDKAHVDDIANHWARNELQLMLDYEALDVKDGKVNPDQTITRGELVKMLVVAMNGGNRGIYYSADRTASFNDVKASSQFFVYVENAVDRGLLDPGADFNPGAKVNREDMAQLIVKALGYKSLTKFDGVFNANFADSGKLKNVGDAAIVTGLDILSLVDDKFEPLQEVSKAQAASAFFRFLQKRVELQGGKPRFY